MFHTEIYKSLRGYHMKINVMYNIFSSERISNMSYRSEISSKISKSCHLCVITVFVLYSANSWVREKQSGHLKQFSSRFSNSFLSLAKFQQFFDIQIIFGHMATYIHQLIHSQNCFIRAVSWPHFSSRHIKGHIR